MFGTELVIDSKAQKLTKYNAGAVWEAADRNYLGIKHESTDDKEFKVGKLLFYFFHNSSAFNTVGTEFSYNWQSKLVEARFGLSHRFDDNTVGKLRFNNKGDIDGALKHTITPNVTTVFVT